MFQTTFMRKAALVPLVSSSMLAPTPALAAPATPVPAPDAVPTVRGEGLTVDTSELGAAFDDLAAQIRRDADATRGADPEFTTTLEIRWADPQTFRYLITVTTVPTASDHEPVTVERACDGCTQDAVAEAALAAMHSAEQELARREHESESQSEAPAVEPQPEPQAVPPPASPSPARQARPREPDRGRVALEPIGWAGVSLLTLGAGAAAAGVAFLVLDQQPIASEPTNLRDWRPAGIAATSGGAGALVAGAVLLGIDRHRARQRLSASAVIGDRWTGISLRGRF